MSHSRDSRDETRIELSAGWRLLPKMAGWRLRGVASVRWALPPYLEACRPESVLSAFLSAG